MFTIMNYINRKYYICLKKRIEGEKFFWDCDYTLNAVVTLPALNAFVEVLEMVKA